VILFHAVVPGKPIPQGRARVPRFGKPYYPPTSKAFRLKLVNAFMLADNWMGADEACLSGPCSVAIDVAGLRANGDLDNMAKGVLDALQDAGVLASDDVRTVRELVVRVVDGEPRTVVTITAAPAEGASQPKTGRKKAA